MLQRYPHEEMGYATAYANVTLKRVEDWVESGGSGRKGPSKSESVDDGGW
uniref:Uncharacterized protein n=1 Tax=Romanomermis culicivorax TaxID=13658 RepID=A0A915KPP7_ROMCU